MVAAGLAADAASTLLDRCQALLDETPDAPRLSVVLIVSSMLRTCGIMIGLGDASRLGDSVLVCLQ